MGPVLLACTAALLVTLACTHGAIVWLRRHGFGQPIRVDGPTTHQVKRGVPTMGGVVIVLVATASYLGATYGTGGRPSASAWLLLLLLLGCALVGFADDFIKVYLQDNRGLPARAKMAGQTVIALLFGVLATGFFADARGERPASDHLSLARDVGPRLPLVLVLLLIWFLVTGVSNATNLTDGADGLLTGISAMVFGAYTLIGLWQSGQRCGSPRASVVEGRCYAVRDPLDLAVLSAAIAGACAAFLWWNAKPAKIIMGDVGSLALGGALAGLAVMTRTEVLMAVLGGVFVLETLSVMAQVTWFKLTRRLTGTPRRLLLITPIHHHFEQLGWDEVNVVIRFWLVAAVLVVLGCSAFYAEWLFLG